MTTETSRAVTYINVRFDPDAVVTDATVREFNLDREATIEAYEMGLESKLRQAFPGAEVLVIPTSVYATEIFVDHAGEWDDRSPEWSEAQTEYVSHLLQDHFENGGYAVEMES